MKADNYLGKTTDENGEVGQYRSLIRTVKAEKTKYTFMSREQNAEQNQTINKIINLFEAW